MLYFTYYKLLSLLFFFSGYSEFNLIYIFWFPNVEIWMTGFRYFFFSNIFIQCYKISYKHCFFCVTQMVIFVSIFKVFKIIFYLFLRLIIWSICHMELCYLISMYLGIFQLSVVDFYLIPLWSVIKYCMISILLNLFRCVLWSKM